MVFLTEAAAPAGLTAILGSPIFMFVIIIAIMYFMMIRPQRKRQKEIENFRRGLQPGMEVVTSGGIYGKIKEIDGNIVVVEEYGKEEQDRLMKLQLEHINKQRKEKGLQEITEEQFLNICRPKQITDETVALLVRKDSKE